MCVQGVRGMFSLELVPKTLVSERLKGHVSRVTETSVKNLWAAKILAARHFNRSIGAP